MANSEPILPAGKLPAELLGRLLSRQKMSDPRVIIGPRVGTDAAAIDMGDSVLVVKTDPITFATNNAGWYLVNVNANDIACMGAKPKWFLVTALLPEKHTTEAMVAEIFESLESASSAIGVTLVGGHTEITIGLDRPILVGHMLGETTHDQLLDVRSSHPGDAILLCKGIAIEGTALLAREGSDECLSNIDPQLLQRASQFLTEPGISVVSAARILTGSSAAVRGMHDPTEGGLASALRELSAAAGLSAGIHRDAIMIYPETIAVCEALDIDPMGLISSGALLAVIDPQDAPLAITALAQAGIPCVQIGSFTIPGNDVAYHTAEGSSAMPEFAVDEIARYFARKA